MDSENENALIKNKIKADSKPKAVVEDEIKEQLKAIVALWDEQTALKKKIKSDKETLEKKTIAAIEGFNMKDINRFLDLKWIEPITSAIAALPNAMIQSLTDAVTSLNEKYAVTYRDIENSIVDSEQELAKLIDQLTGDEYAIAGLSNLFKK
jgi:type I restriction enzyme M protein